MVCQKCQFPHASRKGCISCGWVFSEDYHPELGAAPAENASWIISQNRETLEKIYGYRAGSKLVAAHEYLGGMVSVAPEPPPIAAEISHSVAPVASPFKKKPEIAAVLVEPVVEAEPEPEPVADERMHAAEEEVPTVEKPKRTRKLKD